MRRDVLIAPAELLSPPRQHWLLRAWAAARGESRAIAWLVIASIGLGALSAIQARADGTVRGLPLTSSYPLEEIGNVTRGARLDFDSYGRLAVIQEGVYAVLNDTSWIDLAENVQANTQVMVNVVQASDGNTYYGGRGYWGIVRVTANGRLHAESLVPPNAPEWTRIVTFDHIVPLRDGVYFAGWGGAVYWNFAKKQSRLFEMPELATIFRMGNQVYVSSFKQPLQHLDGERGTMESVPIPQLNATNVDFAADLDATHTLLYAKDGPLLVCDGREASPWPVQARYGLTGRVSALCALADGGIAVAISGKGLFLFSDRGELTLALTTPQYHRITQLAARERGVLWAFEEDAIERIFYGGPWSTFGQRVGLPISWPTVLRWRDRIVVTSGGRLYEAISGPPGTPSRFELMTVQPTAGAWAAASNGTDLLVGNVTGIYRVEPSGRFTPMRSDIEVAHLVMVGPDLCYAISRKEIAVLRATGSGWVECAPRIAGVGNPLVVHASKRAVWYEFGGDKVGRLSLEDGRLQLRIITDPTWKDAAWVNIGFVGDLVVLDGSTRGRRFVDDRTGQFCAAPHLARLLARSPYWITRIQEDNTGVLWATHRDGIVRFTPKDGDYEIDSSTFDLITDHYPVVRILPGNDVWVTGGRSLCHVEQLPNRVTGRPLHPVLVSLVDARTDTELVKRGSSTGAPLRLNYGQNSLRLRFFSGSYVWRRPPTYEFRLNGSDTWSTLAAGSALSLSGLREGSYQLETRVAGATGGASAVELLDFEISPPWFRSPLAYAAYVLGTLLAIGGIVRWAGYRTGQRNLALERLVRERTSQLESTMDQLNEETRISATLDERNRLAGEIHDSLQQGLSGAILQLDSTLLLPVASGQLRSRLEVVRNMLSYARHEVQHAVWDMESPLLEGHDLGDALRKLATLVNPGTVAVTVEVAGSPVPLPAATKHHLLRIAQEGTNNAVRHAHATSVAIRLEYGPDAVALAVIDDGIGFQPEAVLTQGGGHFGLRGLRARARRMNVELQIQSIAQHGTTIAVTVPLGQPPNRSPRMKHDAVV